MGNLFSVKQFSQRYPAFSESSLRYHIFHEKTNGLNRAIRRVGRKVIISEPDFIEWIEKQGEVKNG
jgi:hypothetical protein